MPMICLCVHNLSLHGSGVGINGQAWVTEGDGKLISWWLDKKANYYFFILEHSSQSYYFIWYDVTFFNLESILYFYPYFGKKTTNVYIWSFYG